eukprot:scaffold324776_cov18-Prasinocladus_malaysianus.AAC.1
MASSAMYHCKNEPIKSNVVLCCLPAKRQDLDVSKWTRFHALAKDNRPVSGANLMNQEYSPYDDHIENLPEMLAAAVTERCWRQPVDAFWTATGRICAVMLAFQIK